MPSLSPVDENTLRLFRSAAQEVRDAYRTLKEASGEMRIVGGYLESKDIVQAYRGLCRPVRRAYLPSDVVSFRSVMGIVQTSVSDELSPRFREVVLRFEHVKVDVASSIILMDRQVSHREVFAKWLDATVFGEFGGKDLEYRALLAECGKAVEGIAVRLTESIADLMLELDAVVSELLGERSEPIEPVEA